MTTKTTANSAVVFLFTTNHMNDSCHNISFVLYLRCKIMLILWW